MQFTMRRVSYVGLAVLLTATLAACGGGSGSGGGGGGTPLPQWNAEDYSDNFSPALAQAYAASPAYDFVDFDLGGFNGHPYTASRIHVAMSAGLTGEGLWVQVVDAGFLTDHDVFAGTTFDTTYDLAAPDDHGTHVASLIGANGGKMTGVAPGVNLALVSGDVNPTNLANATAYAAALGAVAQNNSWGYVIASGPEAGEELLLSHIQDHMAANDVDAYQALTAFLYGSNAQWRRYVAALDDFQDTGVIVWALSNNDSGTLTDVDATAAFGLLFPELSEAYITVANALVDYTTSPDLMALDITDIQLLSVVCGSTAHHCITADGTTTAAEAYFGPTDYWSGTGTSYATPIVTGSVALVAQAFPNLSPAEWTARILASANMDIPGFVAFDTVDFGNGIVKPYDWQYGHGVLDVAAALSPIGEVALLNGANVHDAERFDLSRAYLESASAYGDAWRGALGGREIAVFDALNGDFMLDAGMLATEGDGRSLFDSPVIPRLAENGTLESARDAGAWGLLAGDAPATPGGYAFGLSAVDGHTAVQERLGLVSENVAGTSVLSLAGETTAFVGEYDLGFARFEQYGFVGTHSETADGLLAGVGGALGFEFGSFGLKLGASQIAEQGAFLGMTASEAFALPGETAITTASLSATAELASNLTLFGGLEYGVAFGGAGGGLLADLGDAQFSGFQLGLRATGMLQAGDQLTLTASQPLRVEHGSFALSVPTGRLPNGDIVAGLIEAPLAASGRQIDIGLSYAFSPADNALLRLGVVHSFDAGHVAGASATALAAAFTQSF